MQARSFRTRRVVFALALAGVVAAVKPAHAGDSLTVMWDPNTDTVGGYAVYIGQQPGQPTQRVDVGNTTTFLLTTAVAGQQYCFSVAAYLDANTEGPKSTEVCGFSNQAPVLTSPGNQASIVGQPVSLQLSGSDPDGQPVSYSATGLPPGLSLMASTGMISGTATTAGNYSVTAKVSDGALFSSPVTFSWTVSAVSSDTTAPSISISSPTSGSSYSTSNSSLALGGSAADNVGVTSVTWSSDRGGNGTATGTTSWNVPSIGLQGGSNVITVTARDAAGNTGTDVLTVTYTAPDTTAPSITITTPTTSSSYATTSATMALGGSASDNVGVTAVTWSSDRGGSGTASGTTSWSVPTLTLQAGTNVITVKAKDAAGNVNSDVLTVTYTAPDTTAPTVTILGPTSASTYSTTSSVVTIGGTASDDTGVTAVTWANDRGGAGFSSGTTSWSVPTVNLQSGTNVITVTAQDAAGNKGTDVLTVTYTVLDTSAPSIAIVAPTSASSYATSSSTLSLGGSAADDTGVAKVTWANDRGGSGNASGTTSWSVSSVELQSGTNVITVTAQDTAGNKTSQALAVTYSAPAAGTTPSIELQGTEFSSGRWVKVQLMWSYVDGRTMDVYRDGVNVAWTSNNGTFTDSPKGTGIYSYFVCVSGTNICSNTVTIGQ